MHPWVAVALGATAQRGRCQGHPCFAASPLVATLGGGVRFPVAPAGRLGHAWGALGAEAVGLPVLLSSDPTATGWLAIGRAGVTGVPALSLDGGVGRFRRGGTDGRLWRVGGRVRFPRAWFGLIGVVGMSGLEPNEGMSDAPQPFRPWLIVAAAGRGF